MLINLTFPNYVFGLISQVFSSLNINEFEKKQSKNL